MLSVLSEYESKIKKRKIYIIINRGENEANVYLKWKSENEWK